MKKKQKKNKAKNNPTLNLTISKQYKRLTGRYKYRYLIINKHKNITNDSVF